MTRGREMIKDEMGMYVRWDKEHCIHTMYAHWFTMEVSQSTFVDRHGQKSYMYQGTLYDYQGRFCGDTEYFHGRKGFFELEKTFRTLVLLKKQYR